MTRTSTIVRRALLSASLVLALSAPAGAAQADDPATVYYPYGPQTDVPVSTVTDGSWTECYRDTYNVPLQDHTSEVLASCTGRSLMLAGRPTGSDTLSLLAAAPREDVLFETGLGDISTTHSANGSEWYFDAQWSWGFASEDSKVYKNSCDVPEYSGQQNEPGYGDLEHRLCWHTTYRQGGFRLGSTIFLNSDPNYERIVYQSDADQPPAPQRPQSITFTSTAPVNARIGDTYTVSATGGRSGNPVTFSIDPSADPGTCSIDGATVTFTRTGTCVIDADQAAGGRYTAAPQVQQTVAVAKKSQTIRFTSKAPKNPQPDSDYTAKAVGGGSGNPVTFSTTSSSCTVTPAGKVHFTVGGDCVIAADQEGDDAYAPAPTATQTIRVKARAQAIKYVTPPPTTAVKGTQAVVKATGGGSVNPVVFSVDQARSTANACTVANEPGQSNGVYSATVSFTGTGKCVIDADQAGNTAFSAAPQIRRTTTVRRS